MIVIDKFERIGNFSNSNRQYHLNIAEHFLEILPNYVKCSCYLFYTDLSCSFLCKLQASVKIKLVSK